MSSPKATANLASLFCRGNCLYVTCRCSKDADISIRRRALDLLFVMADESNGADIVEELVTYLATSDAAIREEMVLKIAILAEKFTDDLNW